MELRIACAALVAGASFGAAAAQVDVMSVGAVKAAFGEASAQWARESSNTVQASFDPAGDVRKKIASGQHADIVILPVEALDALQRDGVVAAGTRRDLGAVAIAAAVKQGAAVPDISTPEALKQTLLAAKSVTYMDPERGTSGRYFDGTVLPALGVREQVRAKAKLGEGGYIAEKVASGEVEIAFHNLTEILPVKGVTIVGPLPASLQKPTVYSGAVMKDAKNPVEAQALLDYLSTHGRKSFTDRGFTAP